MNKARIEVALAIAAMCFSGAAPALAQQTPSAGVRLQAGIAKENVDGDLPAAIDIYQEIAADKSAPRDVRARALMQLAGCYEKLGRQAEQVYQQVVREYGDQPAAAQARTRLAALRLAERPATAAMTQRRIELPFPDTEMGSTDGQREIYKDAATGALMISDLAGKNKRVILKPKAGEQIGTFIPSRDLSIVAVPLREGDGSFKAVTVKSDGTGYREYASAPEQSVCGPFWSWDDRYLYSCPVRPDGTAGLGMFSVTDGEVRNLGRTQGALNRPSPDGRFIASSPVYEVSGKVSIMPGQGGDPEVVADNAHLIDWIRDGRYLIITSSWSGSGSTLLTSGEGRPDGGRPDLCALRALFLRLDSWQRRSGLPFHDFSKRCVRSLAWVPRFERPSSGLEADEPFRRHAR
jgi:hypothetical protein